MKNYYQSNLKFVKAIGILLFIFISTFSEAQLDKTHYIPPLFGRQDQGCHYLFLSTPVTTPFTVTITDGSGNFIATQTISSTSSSNLPLGCTDTTKFLVTEAELNTVLQNEGLILTAPEAFYATVRILAGPQGECLTSKGASAAKGLDFRTGHMFNNTGDAFRKSNTFSFMATENNTTVNILEIKPGVIFRGTTPTGLPLTSPNVTVTLNAGDCYVVAAFVDEASATNNVNGTNGTRITSDKPIVVNSGTWVGGNALVGGNPNTGRDVGFDQIVPSNLVGTEYVLIKGLGIDNEKTFVIATQNGTDVFLDGNPAPVATLNAGDFYVVDGVQFSANSNLYLTSSAPVYLYQMINGQDGTIDDNEKQNGLNFLPPVGCSGGKQVVIPSVDFIGNASINIIADAGAIIYVNGNLQGAGDPVIGTANYVTYRISGFTGDVSVTSDKLLRVALVNESGNIGAAGYFSGFTKDFTVQTQTVNGDNIALEGCIDASFTFSIDEPSSTATVINYTVGGTANNGVDYSYIGNSITIPAGQTSASVIIDAISDGIPEGQESIYIIYQPDLCSPNDTAFLYIDDAVPIEFTTTHNDLSCFANNTGAIMINATGGFTPYTYHITYPNGQTQQYTSTPITNLNAGTYYVQVYDVYGCKADATVVGGIYDADTTFLPDGTGQTYTTTINIAGFDPGATLDSLAQLQQICANMEHSYLGDLQIRIISPTGQAAILKQFAGGGSCNLGIPFASGPVDGANSNLTDPGIGYEYCWNESPVYLTMVQESTNYTGSFPSSTGGNYTDYYLPQGSYTSFQPLSNLLGSDLNGTWTLEVTDQYGLDNGYIFYWNISLMSGGPDTIVEIAEPDPLVVTDLITQAQCGGNDGAINISVTGDYPPFTYLWSNGATTQDISNVPAGTYYVLITDANGCTDSLSYNINNISALNFTSVITSVSCSGGTNGMIDITTSGGTMPYNFSWNVGPTTEDISGLAVGNYTLTVTDANNCIHAETFNVTSLNPIYVNLVSSSNEMCGTQNGSININVTGGNGSYGYNWNNGATTQNLSGISGGNYAVTVTDGNGCTATANFSILNNVSNCSAYCYTNVQTNLITDEICGNSNGAIDISVMDATQPYSVSWNTGATTEDISNLSAGTYTITVTDANQCIVTENIIVNNQTSGLTISNTQLTNEICGNGNGAINISVSGGVLPYSYAWSTGATTEDVVNLSAGNYSVTITDGNGCSFVNSFTINNTTGTLSASAVTTNETCGNGIGSVNLTVSGGASPYTYLWSNSATSQDLNSLNAGSYSVTITDANGCILNAGPYVVNNLPGSLSISSQAVTNEACGNAGGAIDISITGGATPYTYLWNTNATTEDISGLTVGTYSATITDANGCQVQTGNIVIFNGPGTLSATTDYIINEICSNNGGAIYVSVTGAALPVSYSWNTGSTSEDLAGITAGNYSLTVTDANGCTFNINETITNSSGTLQITNLVATDENCGDASGTIDLMITGGSSPFSYQWSNGATSQDLSSLSAGNYSVSITDNNGCNVNGNATINNNAGTLAYTFVATSESCSNGNGSIDLSISGGNAPYTFLWSNTSTTEDLTSIGSGNYSCVITDNSGCVITTQNISIANNPGSLMVSASGVDESCGQADGSINLTVTGGATPYVYTWSPNVSTTASAVNLSAGVYYYTVDDNNGCTITDSFTINNNSGTLMVNNIVVTDENCGDASGAIDITISGGNSPYTFVWSNTATTEDINSLSVGNYSCIITDASGCSVSTNNISVLNNTGTLVVDNIFVLNASCGNSLGAIDITISGGTAPYTYLWSTGATTQDILTGLSAGNYSCDVTDASGCVLQLSAVVQNTAGNLNGTAVVTPETCNAMNGAINLTATGATGSYTYQWSNGATTQDISAVNSGNYTVTIMSGTCTLVQNYTISNNGSNMNISGVTITDEMCGNNSGAVNITVSGGTNPLNFSWSNGSPFEDISNLTAGNYNVTITDVNGCSTNGNFTVNNNTNGLLITTLTVTDENCGNGMGAIDITTSGGTSPLSYSWSNGATTEDLNAIVAGNYSVTVTDNIGCEVSGNATVNNITGTLTASINSITDEVCGDTTGVIDIDVTGGTAPYTFVWSNGETTEDIDTLSAGNYSVIITDNSGCAMNLSATVLNQTSGFIISSFATADEQCGDGSGYVDITITGGASPYSYSWSNAATTEDISGLSAGNYSVTITDNNGCMVSGNYTIQNNAATGLSISSMVSDEDCGQGNGSIEATISGGIDPITYVWTGATPTNCCTYTLDMHDLGNSWNGASIDVTVNGNLVGNYTVFSGGQNTGTFNVCDGELVELNWNTGNFDNEVSFELLDADGNILLAQGGNPVGLVYSAPASCPASSTTTISNLSAGNYSITVTDDFGCSVTQNYVIVNNPISFTSSGSVTDASCAACTDGAIDLTITGSDAPYNFVWSTSSTNEDINNLAVGTYIVTVTGTSGCSLTDTFTVTSPSNISTNELNWVVKLYPNPADDYFTLEMDLGKRNDVSLSIHDVIGKIVYSQMNLSSPGIFTLNLNEHSFAEGAYFIEIAAEGKKQVIKLIISK